MTVHLVPVGRGSPMVGEMQSEDPGLPLLAMRQVSRSLHSFPLEHASEGRVFHGSMASQLRPAPWTDT